MAAVPATSPSTLRYAGLDSLRGLAMVWMTAFHFCFDLQHFGYLRANFYADPWWTLQRTAIVSLFVFCAGLGQAVAWQQAQPWARFWRRWRQIAGCALLVTLGSWLMYPQSFIYFGILHGMALMLLVLRCCAGWGRGLWLLGGVSFAMPLIASYAHSTWAGAEFLNEMGWNWLGLVSRKPMTEDYAPLFPWLGVMCFGMAAGQWCLQHRPHWLGRNGIAPLARLGRWSLSYYMLHQPVLIGALMLLNALR